MNESDIEKKLRSIKPVNPSRSLEGRVARELAAQPGPEGSGVFSRGGVSWFARLGWAGAGAAAAVVAMLSIQPKNPEVEDRTVPSKGAVAAVAATEDPGDLQREMLAVADEGILDDGTSGPARIMRYTSLERRQWSEPGGAITLVEVPREDVVLVPVSFQ